MICSSCNKEVDILYGGNCGKCLSAAHFGKIEEERRAEIRKNAEIVRGVFELMKLERYVVKDGSG